MQDFVERAKNTYIGEKEMLPLLMFSRFSRIDEAEEAIILEAYPVNVQLSAQKEERLFEAMALGAKLADTRNRVLSIFFCFEENNIFRLFAKTIDNRNRFDYFTVERDAYGRAESFTPKDRSDLDTEIDKDFLNALFYSYAQFLSKLEGR
jgi:hypothetical protein